MNFVYPITNIELAISVITSSVLLVNILFYLYLYIKIKEERQFSILWIGVWAFMFAFLDCFMQTSIGIYNNVPRALRIYSAEQVLVSFIFISWISYMKHSLTLTPKMHKVLDISRNILFPSLIIIALVSVTFPDLFLSHTTSLKSGIDGIKQTNLGRGETGIFYLFRDILLGGISFMSFYFFTYEIFINKKFKGNIVAFLAFIFLVYTSLDDAQSIYSDKSLFFSNIIFSRFMFGSLVFSLVMTYISIDRFISATYKQAKDNSLLEEASLQNSILLENISRQSNHIVSLTKSLVDSKSKIFATSEKVGDTILSFKSSVISSIDYYKEFTLMESMQKQDTYSNIDSVDRFISTVDSVKTSIENQKDYIKQIREYLTKSMKSIYKIQTDILSLQNEYSAFFNKSLKVKDTIILNLNKIESFSQLSIQIKRIIILMKDIADKTGILSTNASIQASKSGEWSENFMVVAKEVADLVVESSNASDRLEKLLSDISVIFKNFNNAKSLVVDNLSILNTSIENFAESIKKSAELMSTQNDDNANNVKLLETLYNPLTDISFYVNKEEDAAFNIKSRLNELNSRFDDMTLRSVSQDNELNRLLDDMNKLFALSQDLKSIISELDIILKEFDVSSSVLINKSLGYSKV